MKIRLHSLWQSRTPGERTAVVMTLAIALILLYAWLVQSATDARTRLKTAITTLQAQSVQLDKQSLEYAKLRTAPMPAASSTDLRALVQSQADTAGLSQALLRIDVQGTDRVQVTFGATPFADWLDWIQALQSQQVRIDACRIEALSTAGLVSITAMLVRGPSL